MRWLITPIFSPTHKIFRTPNQNPASTSILVNFKQVKKWCPNDMNIRLTAAYMH